MALPDTSDAFRKKLTRLRSKKAAEKCSPQEILSPIEEDEVSEGNGPSHTSYSEAVTLLRNPEPKVIMPYNPFSEAVDRNLRRIMFHCK